MLGALLIVFREVLEAGLIIGVVLAATRGIPQRARWVWLGILMGVLGACLMAYFARDLAELFHGSGQELFNACALFFAVGMLAWHNAWMSSHGRKMAQEVRALGAEISQGKRPLAAVAVVVGLATLREGSEVVLFLYGILASEGGQVLPVISGGMLGLGAGVLSAALIYFGLVAIPVRHFFSVTAGLVTLLAGGLSSQAVAFLQQGGILELWSIPLWNTSGILAEGSWPGRALHTLIGYTDQPTGMQLLAYVITVLAILLMMNRVSARS